MTTLNPKDIYQGATNLEILRQVGERHQHSKIQVGGKSVSIDAQTAHVLVLVHDALSTPNKVNFVGMLAHSPATFNRIVDFAWKHTA